MQSNNNRSHRSNRWARVFACLHRDPNDAWAVRTAASLVVDIDVARALLR